MLALQPRRLYQGQMLTEAEIEVKREYGRDRGRRIRAGTWYAHNAAKPTRDPSPEDVAWAAGFFQGEGHISADGRTATVAQVEKEPLVALQAMFGGSLIERAPHRVGQNRYWVWAVCGGNKRRFLSYIADRLTGSKRARAATALGGESVAGLFK